MTDNKLEITEFSRSRVLVVGDLMIDEYLWVSSTCARNIPWQSNT